MDNCFRASMRAVPQGPADVDRRLSGEVMGEAVLFHQSNALREVRFCLVADQVFGQLLVALLHRLQDAGGSRIFAVSARADVQEVRGILGHGGDDELSAQVLHEGLDAFVQDRVVLHVQVSQQGDARPAAR